MYIGDNGTEPCGKVMKATIAQYNAESLLTQREQVGGSVSFVFLGRL